MPKQVPATDRNALSSLWGKLASEILMQNWDAAMEDLTRLKETIDNNVSYIFPWWFSEISVWPSYFLMRKTLCTLKNRRVVRGRKLFRLAFVDLTYKSQWVSGLTSFTESPWEKLSNFFCLLEKRTVFISLTATVPFLFVQWKWHNAISATSVISPQ